MKIGTRNYYIDKYGLEEGARKMAEHGYESIDFNLADTESEYYTARDEDFVKRMYEIRSTLKKNGITVNQIHGPWRAPARDLSDDDRAERFAKMTKAMVMAKHLGAGYMAVHPLMPFGIDSPENPDEVYSINKRYYSSLANVAEALGVVICLENMPFRSFPLSSSESIRALVKDIDSPYVRMCFDSGHAHIMREPLGDTLRAIADVVRILHVHDNDGEDDMHLPPYDGNADISDLAEALYDIGFDGVLSLETSPVSETEAASLTDVEIAEREKNMARIAKIIAGI